MRYFAIIVALGGGFAAHSQQLAHFHHLHLNSTDPESAIQFYTKHFNSERARFGGTMDAVWTQKSWILFNKVNQTPPFEILSSLYHMARKI
jgi:hypothetical protein